MHIPDLQRKKRSFLCLLHWYKMCQSRDGKTPIFSQSKFFFAREWLERILKVQNHKCFCFLYRCIYEETCLLPFIYEETCLLSFYEETCLLSINYEETCLLPFIYEETCLLYLPSWTHFWATRIHDPTATESTVRKWITCNS